MTDHTGRKASDIVAGTASVADLLKTNLTAGSIAGGMLSEDFVKSMGRGITGALSDDFIKSLLGRPTIPDFRLTTSFLSPPEITDLATEKKLAEQEKTIEKLKSQLAAQAKSLQEKTLNAEAAARAVEELRATVEALNKEERFRFIVKRIRPEAQKVLFDSDEFRDGFLGSKEQNAFVMSVDIRRSTELMLKARTPEMFASFITTLGTEFEAIVKDSYGVFDKFTGDGVLAFFPEFYSGDDAGFFAVSAADRCHKAFDKHYRANRGSFKVVLKDAALGIGMDYGQVRIVQVADGLTVVGDPVVYACRMGGASSRKTFLNQRAFEQVGSRLAAYCWITESEINIKHEGLTVCYDISLGQKEYQPVIPEWVGKAAGQQTTSETSQKKATS